MNTSPRSTTPGHARRRAAWLIAPVVAALAFAGAAPTIASASPRRAVIVEAVTTDAASAAVASVGGHVDSRLALVSGVAAHVDDAGFGRLAGDRAVRVTPDIVMHATSNSFSAATSGDTQMQALNPGAGWSLDAGSGVGVALIDSGVNATPDLHGDRLVHGPDLSGERDGVDRFGHGTFMAGLIAGDGTASSTTGQRHVGAAPGATVVAVKVAGADGSTSLSRLLTAIGWVIAHEDDYDIGVLNLSFGADVNLPYLANPLSGAVEAAWASGITVVTSSGNEGAGSVTSPGDDPWVVTVGATANTLPLSAGPSLAPWSGRESFPRYSKPDVVAPGTSVVSLRALGSTVDVANPGARIGDTYFRGSGTSMATALVSGAAADLLANHPAATPDDVKGALVDGGVAVNGSTAPAVSLQGADQATPQADWWQHFPIAFGGLGRGFNGQMPWTASRWTASRWTASRWTASRWTASRWTASRWTASRWTASRWTDAAWTDAAWSASRWTASRWTDASWNALAWG
ncbi:MAG TPA: S8 family serine peptidase [Acidimicrobiia bacterium]